LYIFSFHPRVLRWYFLFCNC